MTRPITFLSDYGYADEFAGVCRAVIARDRPRRAGHRPHPRPAAARGARRALCCSPTPSRSPRRASTSRWSIPASAPSGARSRCGRATRSGCWSGPTTACSRSRPSASAASPRRWTSAPRPTGSSRSRRPSTAATCSRRWPPSSRSAPPLAEAGEPVDPAEPRPARAPRAAIYADRIVAHVVYVDGFGNVALNLGHDTWPRPSCGSASGSPSTPDQHADGPLRAHLHRRRPRPGAPLRGLLPHAGAGGQPRERRGDARAGARRRGHAVARAMTFGRAPHRHYLVCDSTNTSARELAAAGAPGGTVVTADEQTAGPRAQGRSWIAPRGQGAPLLGAPAPARGAPPRCCRWRCRSPSARRPSRSAPVSCQVKWPNDVWIDGRKCAGVLIEARPQDGWAVIGVGLNVNDRREGLPGGAPRDSRPRSAPTSTSRRRCAALNERLGHWVDAEEKEVLAAFRRARRPARAGDLLGRAGEGDRRGHRRRREPAGRDRRRQSRSRLGAGEVHLTVATRQRADCGAFLGRRLASRPCGASPRAFASPCDACLLSAAAEPSPRFALAAAPAALGEVAQQLAGDRRGLAGHPHPRPAQDLLALGRVGDGGGQQRHREAAVLLAGGVDEAAGVAPVGAAGGVDQQARAAAWSPASAAPRTPRAARG